MQLIHQNAHRWDGIDLKNLDAKDKIIIECLATGLSTKELADRLHMSPRTAETRRQRLLKKVGVKNSVELIAYAFRNGIL
jgi:DNA-binding NarL/FixJ family response regulator